MQVRLSCSRGFHTMRKLLSPSSPSSTAGGGDHVDSLFRSTSMKLLLDSGNGLTPELLYPKRNRGAVTGQAAATSAPATFAQVVYRYHLAKWGCASLAERRNSASRGDEAHSTGMALRPQHFADRSEHDTPRRDHVALVQPRNY